MMIGHHRVDAARLEPGDLGRVGDATVHRDHQVGSGRDHALDRRRRQAVALAEPVGYRGLRLRPHRPQTERGGGRRRDAIQVEVAEHEDALPGGDRRGHALRRPGETGDIGLGDPVTLERRLEEPPHPGDGGDPACHKHRRGYRRQAGSRRERRDGGGVSPGDIPPALSACARGLSHRLIVPVGADT